MAVSESGVRALRRLVDLKPCIGREMGIFGECRDSMCASIDCAKGVGAVACASCAAAGHAPDEG